jgi:hypothetical protein
MIFFLTLHSVICYSPDDLQAEGSIMIYSYLILIIVMGLHTPEVWISCALMGYLPDVPPEHGVRR